MIVSLIKVHTLGVGVVQILFPCLRYELISFRRSNTISLILSSHYWISFFFGEKQQEGAPGLEDGHVVAHTYPPEVEDFGSHGM